MERWSSRLGFILATTGAAVGIGNIWRFPSVVGRNGGGAYLIPYLIAVFAFGVPLMMLELNSGRRTHAEIVTTFCSVDERLALVGWFVVSVVLVLLSYYLVITGWILAFFLGIIAGGEVTLGTLTSSSLPVVSFIGALLLVGGVLSLGIRDGIERVATVLMPLIVLILVAMAGVAVTLPGFPAGLSFFLTPDFSVLGEPAIWGAAFGQAFFSLSAGTGILLIYGSYVDDEFDITQSVGVIAIADVLVALLAGLVIFPIVFTYNLEPSLGTELAFSTLPAAFAFLPGGQLIGAAFFALLLAAAVTSAVAMMEVGVSTLESETGRSRRQSTVLVGTLIFVLGLPSALSYTPVQLSLFGMPVLDVLDESVGTFGLPVTALLITLTFAHLTDWSGTDGGVSERVAAVSTKYLLPPILVVIIIAQLVARVNISGWQVRATEGESLTLVFLGLCGLVFLSYFIFGFRTRRNN